MLPTHMEKYFLGYGISLLVAIPATYGWSLLLHSAVEKLRNPQDPEPKAERILWQDLRSA
jgi:hypothetical protein